MAAGKGSNKEWENPHDPEAKIGRTKDGATDMIYKPEAVVDLDTGAIVAAQVQPGDQVDHQEMATRILEAQENINAANGEKPERLTVKSVTADKGYSGLGRRSSWRRRRKEPEGFFTACTPSF